MDVNYIILMKFFPERNDVENEKMAFFVMKRTLQCMYLKFIHEIRNIHFMKIIKFASRS